MPRPRVLIVRIRHWCAPRKTGQVSTILGVGPILDSNLQSFFYSTRGTLFRYVTPNIVRLKSTKESDYPTFQIFSLIQDKVHPTIVVQGCTDITHEHLLLSSGTTDGRTAPVSDRTRPYHLIKPLGLRGRRVVTGEFRFTN